MSGRGAALLMLCLAAAPASTRGDQASPVCDRLVSLAPSLTETLYALGLGAHIAGVTRYCVYPEEARRKPRVGGFLDVNFEALVSLRPTAAVLLSEDRRTLDYLSRLGLKTVVLDHRSVAGILDSITVLGRFCGVEEEAARLRAELEARLQAVRVKVQKLPAVRTLVAVGRGSPARALAAVYISGRDGYYSELAAIAGGRNVFEWKTVTAGEMSLEGVMALNPAVILEIIPGFERRGWTESEVKKSWQELRYVEAVRRGRIHVIKGSWADVPGPRFVLLLEELAGVLHPEVQP